MSVISMLPRRCLVLALALAAFAGNADTTIGFGSGGESKHEKGTTYSKDKDPEKTDKTERGKSKEISIGDSRTEKDGNYSKTDEFEIKVGKDKSSKTDNKTRKTEDSNSYSVGYDKTTEHKVEREVGDESLHGKANASVKYGHDGKVSYGDDELDIHIGGGAEGRVEAGGGARTGKIGGEDANVSFGVEGRVEAEVVAKIKGAITANRDKVTGKLKDAEAKIKGELGASVGIEGEVSADMELLGIPVTVKLAGEASIGAKVKGEVGLEYKDGKVRFVMEAGAVLGGGLEGKVVVEVGWDQVLKLADDVGGKIIDKTLGTFTDYDPEFIDKIAEAPLLRDKVKLIIQREMDKNKRWRKEKGEGLLENVLQMIDKGADFGTVYRYVKSLMEDDIEGANRVLNEIKEQIGKNKGEDGEEGAERESDEKPGDDPFDSEPEGDGSGGMCPVPGDGSAGGGSSGSGAGRSAPNARVRRGGGGNTSSKIWTRK